MTLDYELEEESVSIGRISNCIPVRFGLYHLQPVVVESPFAGNIVVHRIYAKLCLRDCIVNRGEAPYASHLLYPSTLVLNDNDQQERKLGLIASSVWRRLSSKVVFYVDLGISPGMKEAVADCEKYEYNFVFRTLPEDYWQQFVEICTDNGLEY